MLSAFGCYPSKLGLPEVVFGPFLQHGSKNRFNWQFVSPGSIFTPLLCMLALVWKLFLNKCSYCHGWQPLNAFLSNLFHSHCSSQNHSALHQRPVISAPQREHHLIFWYFPKGSFWFPFFVLHWIRITHIHIILALSGLFAKSLAFAFTPKC